MTDTIRRDATYPGEFVVGRDNVRYRWTGEKRAPRAGEFFLSGAIIQAYRTPCALATPHYIAVPVEMVECPTCHGAGKVGKP